MARTILIVDDELSITDPLARLLHHQGYRTVVTHNASDGRDQIARMRPDIALVDIRLPDGDGRDFLIDMKPLCPETAFIMITAFGSIRSAMEATRCGASDYFTKPFDPDEMIVSIRALLKDRPAKEKAGRALAGRDISRPYGPYPSPAFGRVMDEAARAAAGEGIVLLMGESGTGKEHLSRWIHERSPRAKGPFLSINCAALPRELAESELFGHEAGAFTGARRRKRGLLELAQGGTLLLDEVGEMDPALQSKMLTFLDSMSFMRVGGEELIRVDTRVLAATNRELAEEVHQGRFRRDLYYRLNVFPLTLPPLRERIEDIPLLVEEMLDLLTAKLRLGARPRVEPDALELLSASPWPGNVRELRNVLERAIMLADHGVLGKDHLRMDSPSGSWHLIVPFPNGKTLHEVTREVARNLILEAFRRGRTKQGAARLLGITRHSLAYQLQALGIDDPLSGP